jgi:hypothetical protein
MLVRDNLLGHSFTDRKLNLNEHGHRCKNLNEINFHNYLLFAGDNPSLDFNLPVEETYPYLVSQNLQMDYYNIAIFNGGLDAFKFNLLSWLKNFDKKPKALIVGFEFLNSFLACNSAFDEFNVANYNDDRVNQIMSAGEKTGFFPGRLILAKNSLLNLIPVTTYQIEFKDKTTLFNNGVINITYDEQILNHQIITELVIEKFKKQSIRQLP